MLAAVKLFENSRLSSGQAARLVGLPRVEFLMRLKDYGVSPFQRIRIGVEHRIFYVAKFEEAVYVLHCFPKKTRRTSKRDLEIGRRRYRTVLRGRIRRE